MFFYCMKAEYHLELINNCMYLLVGRENDCRGSSIPQNRGFHAWLPHPPLVVWNDLYKDHIGFIILIFSFKAIMFQHIKIRIKIGVLFDV